MLRNVNLPRHNGTWEPIIHTSILIIKRPCLLILALHTMMRDTAIVRQKKCPALIRRSLEVLGPEDLGLQ
jgi:hypothetical protein